MSTFLEHFSELRKKETLRPNFLSFQNEEKSSEELLKRDYLTQSFREIVGHGRWRWATLAWDAFTLADGFSYISPLPKKGRSKSN